MCSCRVIIIIIRGRTAADDDDDDGDGAAAGDLCAAKSACRVSIVVRGRGILQQRCATFYPRDYYIIIIIIIIRLV